MLDSEIDINRFYASGGTGKGLYSYCLNTKGCYNQPAKHLEFFDENFVSLTTGVRIGKLVDTDNYCSRQCYDIHMGYREPEHEIKQRGVKKGTTRGSYKIKKKIIKNPRETTFVCKQCKRTRTYIRKGKRLREFCTNACRQKYYRQQKTKKEIGRKKALI